MRGMYVLLWPAVYNMSTLKARDVRSPSKTPVCKRDNGRFLRDGRRLDAYTIVIARAGLFRSSHSSCGRARRSSGRQSFSRAARVHERVVAITSHSLSILPHLNPCHITYTPHPSRRLSTTSTGMLWRSSRCKMRRTSLPLRASRTIQRSTRSRRVPLILVSTIRARHPISMTLSIFSALRTVWDLLALKNGSHYHLMRRRPRPAPVSTRILRVLFPVNKLTA
ncbi:hypothetical protein C8Q73DRAFT_416898 [Cubamyces lactineus]|nr:hypothetical protein C8Q73DRAFT_416898 [Cubamyces lactineus]